MLAARVEQKNGAPHGQKAGWAGGAKLVAWPTHRQERITNGAGGRAGQGQLALMHREEIREPRLSIRVATQLDKNKLA
jgi:hypothetical protein